MLSEKEIGRKMYFAECSYSRKESEARKIYELFKNESRSTKLKALKQYLKAKYEAEQELKKVKTECWNALFELQKVKGSILLDKSWSSL